MAGYEVENNTVFAYFPSESQAEAAVRELRAAGFTRDQISLAGRPDTDGSSSESSTTGSTMRSEGRKAGQAVGGFWDRVRNFFEGDSAEPYADERTRGESGTHEVTDTSNVYEYDSEDFHQSWGTGSAERSRYFHQQYERSGEGIVVSVNAGDRRAEAEGILEANGADLGNTAQPGLTGNRYSEKPAASYTGSASSSGLATEDGSAYSSPAASDLRTPRRIQLYGEVLRVHRDRVQRGEARIRKETITETQNVQVPVTREELVVERVPVSGEQPATHAAFGSDSEEIRVPLTEEVARIEKQPVVREQVNVGKREVTSSESREETVRREELKVENDADRMRKAS